MWSCALYLLTTGRKRLEIDSDADSDSEGEEEAFDPEAHRYAKLAALPSEPPLGGEGVITVQVRHIISQ